jgi:hypothetical protein
MEACINDLVQGWLAVLCVQGPGAVLVSGSGCWGSFGAQPVCMVQCGDLLWVFRVWV